MDEQRIQAYVGLIEQLLGCPQEQEDSLLQANAGLVDAGLVGVMEQYADLMEADGDSNAGWLRQLAGELAQVLGLAEGGASSASAGDTARFVVEIVELIAQTQGNRAQVYEFFRANLGRLDQALLIALPIVFADLIQQNDPSNPSNIAAVFVKFGNLIQQFPLGSRMLNLEMGIAAYEQALTVRTQAAMPIEWAQTTNNLANAYKNRIKGDRAENIEQAIAAYKQALTVMTQAAMPIDWAQTTMNLANAYKNRIKGDRADNIEQAIAAYEQALTVRTQAAMPTDWAQTTNNLATAYAERIKGDRADNIEQAIATYKQALTVRTQAAMPIEWASTTNNLATAYSDRIKGDRADNIEQAIAAYEQALTVTTQAAMPIEWAQTTMGLATAYSVRIKGDRADNIEQAIATYKQALTVTTQAAMPFEWAQTTMNLANAYKNRIKGDRADNIEQAIAAYKQALTVMTQAAMPIDWAQTTNNLANAYKNRIKGDRADNIEQAIAAYEQALTVMTQAAMPIDWAQTTMNLATAYSDRIKGDRAENIEQAIAAYEQALTVMTQAAMPFEWATTTNNLANAYKNRIKGDRAENIEQAIANYRSSLTIFEPARLPEDCRRTARSLANLYSDQQRWPEAVATHHLALDAAEILYQSATLLDSKAASLSKTADLPRRAGYAFARTGDLPKAVLTLEQGRARGLSESLDRDRANLTELQSTHPSLYRQYQDITYQLRDLENQQRSTSLPPEVLRNTGTKLRSELETTIAQIRQVPGYEDFLTPTQWEDIQNAVMIDQPLVYLVTIPNGGMVLTVTVDAIEVLWLNDLTETQLIDLLNQTWFSAYRQSQTDRQGWYDAIDTTTRQLWDSLMGPIVQQLKTLGFDRATLIPTGYLSLLPLHAAWTPDDTKPIGRRYALDDIHITYTPNAKSLTAAQAIAGQVQANSILAIDEPKHRYLDEKAGEYKPLNPLPNSSKEVASAIATFQNSCIFQHEKATRAAVLDALPHATILHCSCHGNVNFQEPLRSGLAMAGDGEPAILTLRDFLALKLTDGDHPGLRLAILSACETGLPGLDNIDEVISLPVGLLQAGVAGVISSLWSVPELSTMVLLSRFYTLWRDHHQPPDQALRQAQIWLRDASANDVITHCQTFIPELASESGQLYRALRQDFSHPYHWAAFSYMGI
jgi:CHAT domain-containing protein